MTVNKMKRIKIFLSVLVLLIIGASQPVLCQVQNLKNLNVTELTDDQIMQLIAEVEKLGMSMEQAATMARARGASEEQIQEVLGRIAAQNFATADSLEMSKSRKAEGSKGLDEDEFDYFSQKEPVDTLVEEKEIFGFKLFNSENLTFEPSLNIQVPKEYIVGTGDEFVINVWGEAEALYQSEVDKSGNISISQIGPIYVQGLTFDRASKLIKNRLTRIHRGMAGSNPDTYAIVNLEAMKSIQVTIVGETMTPGTFTLPGTATLFNALYLSGGPNEFGSYRQIKLIRNGVVIKDVDVYNFLVNADPTENIPLQDQDMIFIPRYNKRIIVEGDFVRTGLFELTDDESLEDLLKYNSGFADKAYKDRLFVHRQTNKDLEVSDVSFEDANAFLLMSGDSVVAESVIDRYVNRVKIGGAIFRPGTYQLSPDMTLLDLINKAQGLREDAYLERAQIFRLNENNDTTTVAFSVNSVMAGQEIVSLMREDSVSIKPQVELHEPYFVEIQGEVNDPGEKPFYENMSVEDLIYLAGGFTRNAENEMIELVSRLSQEEASFLNDSLGKVSTISVSRDLTPNPEKEVKLKPFDRVLVRRAVGYRDQGSVSITGEVMYVGYFSIKSRNDRISDLIEWSNGFTEDAYPEAANLFRFDSTLVDIDLTQIMRNKGGQLDMTLEPGDSLYIPKEPQTVDIVGQVQAPFATTFIQNRPLKYYVKNAGGWSDQPDRGRIWVSYPDGSSQNTKSFIFRRYPKVKPGSTIIIPKKPKKVERNNTAAWLTAATTMSSIGVAVATVVSLLKSN